MAAESETSVAEAPTSPSMEPLKGTPLGFNEFRAEKRGRDSLDQYAKSVVFGGLDGIITTFAVVAAGAGANLNSLVIVMMGIANLVSDGISMGLGDYFSEKSENQYIQMERDREDWEMMNNPEEEVKEMIEIFTAKKKGFTEEDATAVCTVYAKYPQHFVDFMMHHELELGVPEEDESKLWKQGMITTLSFWLFGSVPVAIFAVSNLLNATTELRFIVVTVAVLLTLGLLGAAKAKLAGIPILKSVVQMIGNGVLACGASFLFSWAVAEAMGGRDVLCLGATCESPIDESFRLSNAPWVDYESSVIEKPTETQQWDCTARSPKINVFYSRVNLFSGEVGNYEFAGFDGPSPELSVQIGQTYTFDQTHHTNWYHPLGFGYYPDGAHGQSWGSEERPEIESEGALRYLINNREPTEGLDAYEPQFVYPRSEWLQKKYSVQLEITDEIAREAAKNGGVIYYFCHLHSRMSGKLRIVGNYQRDGSAYEVNYQALYYNPHGTETSLYAPHQADPFDDMCGTYEASPFQQNATVCAGQQFLCGATGTFAECMHAIDCKMQTEMTIHGHDDHGDPIAIFMQQMIPHHTNAVNMARTMLKLNDIRGDEFSNNLMYEIINNQNMQIHEMRNYLANRRHKLPPGAACTNLTEVYALANRQMEHPDSDHTRYLG